MAYTIPDTYRTPPKAVKEQADASVKCWWRAPSHSSWRQQAFRKVAFYGRQSVLEQFYLSHSIRDNNPEVSILLSVKNFEVISPAAQCIVIEMKHGLTGGQAFLPTCYCLPKGIH
jgi:hypothetical protein